MNRIEIKKIYSVALTGGIASGKSSVTDEFAKLGVPIISADSIAKELTKQKTSTFKKIVAHFGLTIVNSSGELNRRRLRQIIFSQPQERCWLENLLHPLIRENIEAQIKTKTSTYCIIEIPLLNNKTHYPYLDRILLIKANKTQRLQRIMTRDNCSKEDALAIIAAQIDEQSLDAIADDILTNDFSIKEIESQVILLHQRYLHFAIQSN
ncbi:MAG: dephospho-CoA kinase [Legionella sp.]